MEHSEEESLHSLPVLHNSHTTEDGSSSGLDSSGEEGDNIRTPHASPQAVHRQSKQPAWMQSGEWELK